MMPSPAVRVGIVGAGVSATTFHAPFLVSNPSFKLTRFLRTSGRTPVAGFEKLQVETDMQQFLSDIDLVVITTPTYTHASIAKACLQAGKHVILEKPMCTTFAEATQLCTLARQHNLLLAVYHNRRWDGDFRTVSALVKSGSLGRIVEFESHFDRFRNAVKPGWKEDANLPGSGILYDLGAHLIDQALVLFGLPDAVTAHLLNQRHLPATTVSDAFTVTLHYELPTGPLTVILRASMLTKQPGARFAVHGTLGSYIKHGMDVQEGQLRAGMSPLDAGFGVEGSTACSGVLDTLAVDLVTLTKVSGVTLGDKTSPGLESVVEDQPLEGDMAAANTAAAGVSDNSDKRAAIYPSADVATVAAAVLAGKDAGVTFNSTGDGSKLRVITEDGCWSEFYNNIAQILLGHGCNAPGTSASNDNVNAAAAGEAPIGMVEAAAAIAAPGSSGISSRGSSSSGRCGLHQGNINSKLVVQPEQAADVIWLIELAMKSASEGRTIRFDKQKQLVGM